MRECGSGLILFRTIEDVDKETGEILESRIFEGEYDVPRSAWGALRDGGLEIGPRGEVVASSAEEILTKIGEILGRPVRALRKGALSPSTNRAKVEVEEHGAKER